MLKNFKPENVQYSNVEPLLLPPMLRLTRCTSQSNILPYTNLHSASRADAASTGSRHTWCPRLGSPEYATFGSPDSRTTPSRRPSAPRRVAQKFRRRWGNFALVGSALNELDVPQVQNGSNNGVEAVHLAVVRLELEVFEGGSDLRKVLRVVDARHIGAGFEVGEAACRHSVQPEAFL